MQDFKKLMVWQKSHSIVLDVYRVTKEFPKDEMYGVTSQLRRAAISVPANIAEGCGKNTSPDFARYLQNAMGSASECQYFVTLGVDLGYIGTEQGEELSNRIEEVKRMLASLLQKARSKPLE